MHEIKGQATARIAEQAIAYRYEEPQPRSSDSRDLPAPAAGRRGGFVTTSPDGQIMIGRTVWTARGARVGAMAKTVLPGPKLEERESESLERALHFLRTAPHKRAKRSPETIARALALIGAAKGLPPDASENLDDYLYGDKK